MFVHNAIPFGVSDMTNAPRAARDLSGAPSAVLPLAASTHIWISAGPGYNEGGMIGVESSLGVGDTTDGHIYPVAAPPRGPHGP
jgi:hypothetical protein